MHKDGIVDTIGVKVILWWLANNNKNLDKPGNQRE